MERRLHPVVSLEKGKVNIVQSVNGDLSVTKKTDQTELKNIILLKEHLLVDNNSVLEWIHKYQVVTPAVLSWNDVTKTLEMHYFAGKNLEILLSETDQNTRDKYVGFLCSFIEWMREKGIFWKDAAPRNIIINEEQRRICLVDFERGCSFQYQGYTKQEFNRHLQGLVFEEMSAFLFINEREVVFGNIWEEEDGMISKSVFRGKREPLLYQKIFGSFQEQISMSNLNFIRRFMAEMLTPYYLKDGKLFFPLTKLARAGSPEKYTSLLLELLQIDKDEWPNYLSNSIR